MEGVGSRQPVAMETIIKGDSMIVPEQIYKRSG
jgi:hypothetical protein